MIFASKAKWATLGSPSFSFALDFFSAPGQSPPNEDQVHHYRLHYYLLTKALAEQSSSSKISKG
jgi:phosphatidylethanolamine-binding protein (PEBP) family uncharacterized protein